MRLWIWVLAAGCVGDDAAPERAAPGDVASVIVFEAGGLALDPWDDFVTATLPFAVDLDGDGWLDLVGGEAYYDGDLSAEGIAAVWPGGPSGFPAVASWTAEGDAVNRTFGPGAVIGDVNGDGSDEIALTSPADSSVFSGGGSIALYNGVAGGFGPVVQTIYGAKNWLIGTRVAGGDFNGDGYADLVSGSPVYGPPKGFSLGRADVFAGGPNGASAAPTWSYVGVQNSSDLGGTLAAADFDADGYDDLLVGATLQDTADLDAGAMWLFPGGPNGPAAAPARAWSGDSAGDFFAERMVVLPDLDADGYPELAVTSEGYVGFSPGNGKVQIFAGSAAGLGQAPVRTFVGGAGEQLGRSIAAGDVDGDGWTDLLLGIGTAWDTESSGGVQVYYGGPAGLPAAPNATWTCPQSVQSCFQTLVRDFDRDGSDDVLLAGSLLGGFVQYAYHRNLDARLVLGGPDADHDGDRDLTDCAPFDPVIHAGADETWYDDVDQNCDGADDWDQDGDGYALTPRGTDGDDLDPEVTLALSLTGTCAAGGAGDVVGATPGGRVVLFTGVSGSSYLGFPNTPCSGVPIQLDGPVRYGGRGTASGAGVATFPAPGGHCGSAVVAVDFTTCRRSQAASLP